MDDNDNRHGGDSILFFLNWNWNKTRNNQQIVTNSIWLLCLKFVSLFLYFSLFEMCLMSRSCWLCCQTQLNNALAEETRCYNNLWPYKEKWWIKHRIRILRCEMKISNVYKIDIHVIWILIAFVKDDNCVRLCVKNRLSFYRLIIINWVGQTVVIVVAFVCAVV